MEGGGDGQCQGDHSSDDDHDDDDASHGDDDFVKSQQWVLKSQRLQHCPLTLVVRVLKAPPDDNVNNHDDGHDDSDDDDVIIGVQSNGTTVPCWSSKPWQRNPVESQL